ncbi:MAG TPA: HAD family phosphatase [Nocardioidaceae bacterium]|nr:HAD family phosphatase [Nocardioidaceae bacterium]
MTARSLVIFDCDGVLVDSERLTVEIEARYLAEIGWPLSPDDIVERFLGRTEDVMVAAIEDQIGRPVSTEWRRRWLADTEAALDESLEAVPGISDAIDALVHAGYAICVGSSGRPEKIERNLTTTGLLTRFDVDGAAGTIGRQHALFSAVEVVRGKPEPDLFLLAAETMGIGAGRCVVVEDSRYGVTAALAAGMRVIGFSGGLTKAADLDAADLVISDMGELPTAAAALVQS